ncbi:RagB/SusD family nutrient uptake outer membrane protein [Fibrella sp. HMF5335]|uniref:RagB/SusD family nutrient uptake outer membrane protein n=1 Tax=Fibrella rubiginis TaxID=2817060 RepID=A0A939G9U4_9BACT|nr:RagB/SusD family nutrient uptake outer membrane protein [Fibrella rubiginis]MBO0934924.1 RagB/SusD family nutrient uptake outer membrane protein [Fibrella rubiginis]
MNYKLTLGTGTLLLGLVWACNDKFLEQKPFGAVNESTLSANLTGADALLIAAYSNMDGFSSWDNGSPWGSAASNWTYGSIAGGDAYKGSEANDQPDVVPIERHETNANNPYPQSKWNTYYDGIARANKAIQALKAITGVTEATRTAKIAEARFLRGFYHYELKRTFNKVPYIDDNVVEFRIPNDKDIWANIQDDLKFAAANLPLKQTEPGRATKGAAQGILGISLMWQQKYGEAKPLFDAIIASGVYKLNAKYQDNFDAAIQNSPEGVLEVQQAVNIGTDDQGNNGDVLNFPYGSGPGGCCGFHQPSQNLVNAFRTDANGLPFLKTYNDVSVKNDEGTKVTDTFIPDATNLDPRLDWTVGRRSIPYLDWGLHGGIGWQRDPAYAGSYSPKKNVYYKSQEGTLTSASGWTKGYNTNNVKLLRYSDVLLLAAECEVEVGSLEKARDYVNQVRKRAANPDGFVKAYLDNDKPEKGFSEKPAANYVVKPYATAWTDKAVARDAVRFERRIELGMEGNRRFDLVRWGVADQVLNDYLATESKRRTYLTGAKFTKGKSEYEPIPNQAITRSSIDGKPTLVQNDGY